MERPHRIALLLNQEIAAVVTAMRQNSKWALVPSRYQDAEVGEDPLLDDFKLLRRRIFHWHDWTVVDPLEYLAPFLEVIKSQETSGPITGVALVSVSRLLKEGVIGSLGPGAAAVIQTVADAVTQCKFEATYPASDEVVLYRILQVLLACMKCPAGQLLTDDNVINIFQACFRIGHYQTERSKDMSELLTMASRQILVEMVSLIFSRLGSLPQSAGVHSVAASHPHSPRLQVPPLGAPGASPFAGLPLHGTHAAVTTLGHTTAEAGTSTADEPGLFSTTATVGSATAQPLANAPLAAIDEAGTRAPGPASPASTAVAASGNGVSTAVDSSAQQALAVAVPTDAGAPAQEQQGSGEQGLAAAKPAPAASKQAAPALHHTVSVAPPSPVRSTRSAGNDEAGHGLESMVEVLGFIISLINSDGEGPHTDLNVFGLELMHAALNAATTDLEHSEALMALLREDVWPALFHAARSLNLSCLTGACQVALSLYVHLGQALLLQLEAFVAHLLLRLAEGRAASGVEHQEAALEGLLDLCNQPGFVRDVYVNLDCRIERSNLFESICALLSKAAFPVNAPLGPAHLLALDGLFSILSSLAHGCTGSSTRQEVAEQGEGDAPADLREIWDALCNGLPPPLRCKGAAPLPTEPESTQDNASPSATRPAVKGTDSAAVPSAGASPPTSAARTQALVQTARREKYVKARLALAADHFNRDYKKGFQFLQTINLLPAGEDPTAVARFLRCCPGLSKQVIGELLGDNDDFFLEVLDAFTQTFDFRGTTFDGAIRMYLESFRLPGEAQKINRIMESFGKHYHQQAPEMFKNSDAVYILAYSVIMLNTDQHNNQVKKKMTVDEFIRNNRGINGGDNLPADVLRHLYTSIAQNEIRISSEQQAVAGSGANGGDLTPMFWAELQRAARAPRGRALRVSPTGPGTEVLERDMFVLMWGPTVAAVSVVLDHAEEVGLIRQALDGLLLAAKMAAHHGVDEVMDSLVVSLSKFTALLNPAAPKPAVAFGESDKARLATETVFALANRYGDRLGSGWRNVVDCCVRLHRLGLLPPAVLALEAEDATAARARLPRVSSRLRTSSASSLITRAFSSLISIEGAEGSSELAVSAREAEAEARTAACIAACRLEDIFADSKFLRADSLAELVKAVMWASGPLARAAHTGEDSETAELCLELLITIVLRNRDRINLIWPLVHDYLAIILSPDNAQKGTPLVTRAVLGLLRVCQRLLPYNEAGTAPLLRSLQLILRLNPGTAWDLAVPLAAEVLALLRSSARHIRTVRGWRTVCAIVTMTSLHPDAATMAFEALATAASEAGGLAPVSFSPCFDTALIFIDRHAKDAFPQRSLAALDVVETMGAWLVGYAEARGGLAAAEPDWERELAAGATAPWPGPAGAERTRGGSSASAHTASSGGSASPTSLSPTVSVTSPLSTDSRLSIAEQWLQLLQSLAKAGQESSEHLRNHAIVILHRTVMASEAMEAGGARWAGVVADLMVPLLSGLARLVAGKSREHPGVDKTLRMAVNLATKTVLQYLPLLKGEPAFPEAWNRLLLALQDCTRNRSEELVEAVPEALKNTLLVMAARQLLTPAWLDANGNSLWELTWLRAHAISSGLTPALLSSSGLIGLPASQPAGQPAPHASSACVSVDSATRDAPATPSTQPAPVSGALATSAAGRSPADVASAAAAQLAAARATLDLTANTAASHVAASLARSAADRSDSQLASAAAASSAQLRVDGAEHATPAAAPSGTHGPVDASADGVAASAVGLLDHIRQPYSAQAVPSPSPLLPASGATSAGSFGSRQLAASTSGQPVRVDAGVTPVTAPQPSSSTHGGPPSNADRGTLASHSMPSTVPQAAELVPPAGERASTTQPVVSAAPTPAGATAESDARKAQPQEVFTQEQHAQQASGCKQS